MSALTKSQIEISEVTVPERGEGTLPIHCVNPTPIRTVLMFVEILLVIVFLQLPSQTWAEKEVEYKCEVLIE